MHDDDGDDMRWIFFLVCGRRKMGILFFLSDLNGTVRGGCGCWIFELKKKNPGILKERREKEGEQRVREERTPTHLLYLLLPSTAGKTHLILSPLPIKWFESKRRYFAIDFDF